MRKAMKRVMYCGPGLMRALALRAGQVTTVPGEKLTPAIMQRYGRHLIIMDGRTRQAEFIGADIADRYLVKAKAQVTPRTEYGGEAPVSREEPQPEAAVETPVVADPVEGGDADQSEQESGANPSEGDDLRELVGALNRKELAEILRMRDVQPKRSTEDCLELVLELDDLTEDMVNEAITNASEE